MFICRAMAAATAALGWSACALADSGSSSAPGILANIDARAPQTEAVAMPLWDIAEIGYQETKSADILKTALLNEGFDIETSVAGIPTAFVGSWGEGGPVIAVLAEYDALPGVNQAAVPTVGVRTATWVPGTADHSWQVTAASDMSVGVKGTQLAAKAMALTAIDLYRDETLRAHAHAEFHAARGPDDQYASLLGDRDPPFDYRH